MIIEIDNIARGRDAEMKMVTEFVVIGNWPGLPHFADNDIFDNADTRARVANIWQC